MKSVVEVLPIIREQVKAGIWKDEEEGVIEYKKRRERRF